MYPTIDIMFSDESPKSLFEIGCANSEFLLYYKTYKTKEDIEFGGMDRVANYCEVSAEKFPEWKDNFYLHDVNNTPFPIKDNSFDIVFSVGVLLLIPNCEPVIKEMLRICKDKIIFAEYQNDSKDEYGDQGNIPQPPVDSLRIERNYKKILDKLGVPFEITGNYVGKTIFKCKKI